MKTFEIFFSDLNTEAQQNLMDVVGIKDPKEMNWDIDMCPIAILEYEDDIESIQEDRNFIFLKGT